MSASSRLFLSIFFLSSMGASLSACGAQNLDGASGGLLETAGASSDDALLLARRRHGDRQTNGQAMDANVANVAPGSMNASSFQIGAILDYDGLGPHGKSSAASFVKATDVVPPIIDTYVRVKSDGSFETSTAELVIDQAVAAKVPTVCLSVTSEVQGKLSQQQLDGLVEAVKYGKDRNTAIQIRFGYEMNGYWSPSNKTNGTEGDPSNFLSQWAQVAPVVQAAGGLMFWSPNFPFSDASALSRWQPKDGKTIDIVGLDYYPKADDRTTAGLRAALDTINGIAKSLNKPLVFGETGIGNTGGSIIENAEEANAKLAWLNILIDANVRNDYPLYQGFRWFDYQKFENNTWNNFSISADATAAAMFSKWYKGAFSAVNSGGATPAADGNNVSGNTTTTGAATGNGANTYSAVSMDVLKPLVPGKLQAIWSTLESAAKTYGIQPQLLVAIAMAESTGGSNPAAYSNGGGMFQFTNDATWGAYGNGAQRSNDAASAVAAAHYISDNLKASNNSLNDALRLYNGPISQGGNPNYQNEIQQFMLGKNF